MRQLTRLQAARYVAKLKKRRPGLPRLTKLAQSYQFIDEAGKATADVSRGRILCCGECMARVGEAHGENCSNGSGLVTARTAADFGPE